MPTRGLPGVLVLAAVGLLGLAALSAAPATTAAAADSANVTLYGPAPASLDDPAAIEAAIGNGTLRPVDKLVVGDRLVVAIDSERLAASIDDADGSPTAGFLDAVSGNATFTIVQTNPGTSRPPKLASVGPTNVTAHRAGATTYVVVDTGGLEYHYEGSDEQSAELHDGDRFAVTFGYGLEPDADSGPTVALYGAAAELGLVESGEPLAPERVELPVQVNIDPDEGPFVRLTLGGDRTVTHRAAPVEWSGFQGVSFDLRGVEPGTAYSLELIHDGAVVERVEGTVETPSARVANVTLAEVTTDHVVTRDGERVVDTVEDHVAVNATVRLSHGGKVVVLDGTCEQVGVEWVDPGVETRVSVELWKDSDPVRGRDLAAYGVAVRTVRVDMTEAVSYPGAAARATHNWNGTSCPPVAATPTVPTTETATPDDPSTIADTPTLVTASDSPPSSTDRTMSPGQPGFTLTAAVVAGLVLLLSRRP